EDGAWAVIRVSDTGPGIPPDQREAIFDEFRRLDESSSTKGHGLGLAVARGLARQLDGDLVVADSTQGAEFVLRLPRRRPTSSRPDAALA
ncbi:MAG TPA: ATP-binding protein, partial [Longimicrobiales bacterium]|nr:ATP-binding protein [Longimicrobiales bacterium]